MQKALTAILILLFAVACQQQLKENRAGTRIEWDSWGVPHIFADSAEALFFADGWAQMQAHANTILRLYGSSRGRGAEYWGEKFLDNDRLVHTLGNPDQAAVMWTRQDPELKKMLGAFISGMNAYAKQHPGAIEDSNRPVLPITVTDTNLHSLFVVNSRFIAGRELGLSRRWEETGSNSIAVGPSRSESGHAMLVMNPHLPWQGEFLFFEKHALLPDKNIYGASLVGLPGFAIAFNDQLGWSHTNNTIDNSDLYELDLQENGYLFDGELKPFETNTVTLKVRDPAGQLAEKEISVQHSIHGPVIRKGNEHSLALRYAGKDSYNSLLQWWRMASASDFDEFETALKMQQIPFWNVMYADREGNIFYLFNGQVPKRSNGDWAYWQGIVPGNTSDNLWTEVHPYGDLPQSLNPSTGWLQNANDPPWTSTLPMQLDPEDYPAYMSPRQMLFRPQRAARMMLEDESVSFDELVSYKHDTRVEMADRLLDDLLAAVDQHGTGIGHQAANVLRQWKRGADNESRGMALFYNWAMKMNPYRQQNYAVPWNEEQPLSTPDGLSEPAQMVELLEEAAREMLDEYGRLDVAWGEVNRIEYNGRSLPANGAAGALGVFRVAAAGAPSNGTQAIRGGDSWVGVIEFSDTPRARVLLSYGNSTQKNSPHFGDQLSLFSDKKLRQAWRTPQQLEGNITKTEILRDGTFVPSGTIPD
jgi:acyl-homoserine-lactone acylase